MDYLINNTGMKVGFWNVNGLTKEKSSECSFQQKVQLFNIIFLSETWHGEGSADKLRQPPGYLSDSVYRKKKKKRGRASGGVLVFYKKELKNIISFLDISSENILWIKISKGVLHATKEVYIAGVYNSPKYSTYTKEKNLNVIDTLKEQLTFFSSSDIIFIGGDFNSRVGTQNDFIVENEKDFNYLPQDYELDIVTSVRNNQDVSINDYGLQLLDLCIAAKLRILNGRTRGDLQGHVTYIGHKGNSTIDLVLTSEINLLETGLIQYLSVLNINHLSDHCPVLLKLSIRKQNFKTFEKQNESVKLVKKPPQYIWKKILENEYSKKLDQETNKLTVNMKNKNNYLDDNFSKIDNLLQKIEDTYLSTANIILNQNKPNKPKFKKPRHQKWFNLTCQQMQRNLNRLGRILTKKPDNHFVKEQYFNLRRKYKTYCRKEKRKFESNLLQNLENMYALNKEEFWDILRKIKGSSNNNLKNQTLPEIDDLDKHYRRLLTGNFNKNVHIANEPVNTQILDSLNNEITLDEIKENIKLLKNKKAPGLDSITNEMIKCSNEIMIKHLQTLFNAILNSGYYPQSWNHGLICSIYKSGKKDDPSNYRGITLSKCLGKLFNTILHNRLQKELKKNTILSPAQAGFREDHRTSDHIFTLFSLINKYLKKGQYLYTCFVDFHKAFDSINRDKLKYKLEMFGIKGKFLDIVASMYNSTQVSLSYNQNISTPFKTTLGLKQGDILSTTFFNLFINDLPMILENQKTHLEEDKNPDLFKTRISSLLFADDLAIFSLTQNGLQEKLDILEKYCRQWDLELNLKKTKVMIFNKQGSVIRKFKFYYGSKEIDTTNQYTYLGFTFIPSGKKHVGIENLLKKGKKAWFSIQKMLNKSKEKTIATYLKLIDSLVKPIILYACECWGDSQKKDIFANKIEQFHMSMCKQIIGVYKSTNNIKVLSELGRTPLKIDIQTKMFKYLQRLPFIETNRFLFKAFMEDELDKKGWVQNMKNILDMMGLSNLMKNIFEVINGVIPKEQYKTKHNFFKKRATDLYLQSFYSYVDNDENKGFFTCVKEKYEIEKYLRLKDFELRKALSQVRLSSLKLAILTGKWYKIKKEERKCKFCDSNEIEDESHFILQCSNYEELRKDLIEYLIVNENVDLTSENKLEKLKLLFVNGSWGSLKTLGRFVLKAYKKRQKQLNQVSVT